jgi:hypothetical protein
MYDKLKKDIEIELENLGRLIEQMQDLMSKVGKEPDFMVTRTAGSILHDFYGGVEKIFERIAVNLDNEIPKSDDWHIKLLSQMAQPKKNRKAITDSALLQDLKEYLRFRHLFRNIYGFELKWTKVEPLCLGLNQVYKKLKESLIEILR